MSLNREDSDKYTLTITCFQYSTYFTFKHILYLFLYFPPTHQISEDYIHVLFDSSNNLKRLFCLVDMNQS